MKGGMVSISHAVRERCVRATLCLVIYGNELNMVKLEDLMGGIAYQNYLNIISRQVVI